MTKALALALLLLLAACVPQFSDSLPEVLPLAAASPPIAVEGKTLTYLPSDENFPNPERGFHFGKQIMQTQDYAFVRKGGATVLFGYVDIGAFRTRPLSDEFLNDLRSRMNTLRQEGIKVVLRFYYTFGYGADAPLARILGHIAQLKPFFEEYQDIILAVQGGFIGAWGEWHSSSHGLDTPQNTKAVAEALLAAVPPSRMVQIRYVRFISNLFPTPLTASQAYNATPQARIGLHNDCFLANSHDAGTYRFPEGERAADKAYLEQMGRLTVVGGETCEVPDDHTDREGCSTALTEMRRYGWSFISSTWYEPVITRWKLEGCYDLMARRLGYRFKLVKAVVPAQIKRGERLRLMLEVANEGFATPFNPRSVQLVLRNQASKAVTLLPIAADPRRWWAGQTTPVYADLPLPATLTAGNYELLLNLPDPAPSLIRRPEYSIRLANVGTWEGSTGYNSLRTVLEVQ